MRCNKIAILRFSGALSKPVANRYSSNCCHQRFHASALLFVESDEICSDFILLLRPWTPLWSPTPHGSELDWSIFATDYLPDFDFFDLSSS
ncbi:hypothetical protein B5X24_HaOG211725 [Helicoverpa armigera]|nr:hypothetical protein B5X24_HaOG211725 [Helicoverpa armigera]